MSEFTEEYLDNLMVDMLRRQREDGVLTGGDWPCGVAKRDSPLDTQVGGDHYKSKGIQPVEYCMANGIGFMEGSVIKYVTRWKEKGGVEDLKKARHFLDMLIEAQPE